MAISINGAPEDQPQGAPRLSKGDIPPKITDAYAGDFNEIKNNLNNCIDAITALVTETAMLIKASAEGKLATRGDGTKHQGDFRKIVEGINEMRSEERRVGKECRSRWSP